MSMYKIGDKKMTDAINTNLAINANAAAVVTANTASPTANSLTKGAVTSASKKELVALKIDTTNIKTESAAKSAIKAAQKKLELKGTEETSESKATESLEDTVEISNSAKKASSAG